MTDPRWSKDIASATGERLSALTEGHWKVSILPSICGRFEGKSPRCGRSHVRSLDQDYYACPKGTGKKWPFAGLGT